jgi:hypothetical protein
MSDKAEELIKRLQDSWFKASEKFDYFSVTASAAICAFFVKDLRLEKLGVNPATLELTGLLLMVGAMAFALRRIQTRLLILQYERWEIDKGLAGKSISDQDKERIAEAKHRYQRLYVWVTRLLVIGFLLVIGARVLVPYHGQ